MKRDQAIHEVEKAKCATSSSKSRQVLIAKLEEMHLLGWKTTREFVGQLFPHVGAKSTTDLGSQIPGLGDWMDRAGCVIGDGVRRKELEHLIFWLNCTTMGVLTSSQHDWIATTMAAYLKLGVNKTRAVGVIILPNRAQHCDYVANPVKSEESASDDEKEKEAVDTFAGLREVKNKLITSLEEVSRGLEVREFTVNFDDASIFGKRRGYLDGIVCTASVDENIWHKSRLWRRGRVDEVSMLPRPLARKPTTIAQRGQADDQARRVQNLKISDCMTPVQVKKQD